MATRTLFLDSTRQLLVSDLVSLRPAGIDPLTEGDTEVGVDIYSAAADTAFATDAVKLAIAIPEDSSGSNRATAGTTIARYTANLTSGTLVTGKRYLIQTFVAGDNFTNVGAASNASGCIFTASATTPTTWTNSSILWLVSADLDFDFAVADLQAAIRDMSSTLFAGLTVTGGTGSPARIVGGTFADLADFSFDMDNLSPQCEQQSIRVQSGDALSKRSIQRISIAQVACALATSATVITAGAVTLDPVTTGVTNVTSAVVDIVLTGSPYAGTVTFAKSPNVSAAVIFNGTSSQFADAIDALYGDTNLVSAETIEEGPVTFRTRLTFDASLGDVDPNTTLLVDGSAVTFAIGRRFSLDLDTINMVEALQNVPLRAMQIELQRTASGKVTTAFDQAITITNDLIQNASSSPLPADDFLTADESRTEFVNNLYGIASLTGGGSTALDGQPLDGVDDGRQFVVSLSGVNYAYRSETSSDATSSPSFIRASDWATSGKGFRLQGLSLNGLALGLDARASQTFSAAGSPLTLTVTKQETVFPIVLSVGAGTFTKTLILAAPASGNPVVEFAITLPASAGRILSIWDGPSSSVAESFTSLGTATTAYFRAYFNGANWIALDSNMQIP